MAGKRRLEDDASNLSSNKHQKVSGLDANLVPSKASASNTGQKSSSEISPGQHETSTGVQQKPPRLVLKLRMKQKKTELYEGWEVPRISGGMIPFTRLSAVSDLFWNTIRNYQPAEPQRAVPMGLPNLAGSNRCYQNAVVTALLSSKRFVAYVRGWHMVHEYHQHFSHDPHHILAKLDRLAKVLNSNNASALGVATEMERFRKSVFFPKSGIMNYPGQMGSWADRGADTEDSQCDASELLVWMLELIGAQLMASSSAELHFSHLEQIRKTRRTCCLQCKWPIKLRKSTPAVAKVLLLNLPESDEGQSSETSVRHVDDKTVITMGECITKELINVHDKDYRCTRCGKTQEEGKITIHKLQAAPEILFVTIVRDQYDTKKHVPRKLPTQVAIEEELDIGSWLEPHDFGKGTSVKYKLAAVVSHTGKSALAGHYFSHVRSSIDPNKWYQVNDDQVTPAKFSDFNDATPFAEAGYKKDSAWKRRATPYIMIYERTHDNDVIRPGRYPMNDDKVTTPNDEQPNYWVDDLDDDETLARELEACIQSA